MQACSVRDGGGGVATLGPPNPDPCLVPGTPPLARDRRRQPQPRAGHGRAGTAWRAVRMARRRRRGRPRLARQARSEEHTSELQSLMRISYAVFCLKKKKNTNKQLRLINR